MKLDDHRIIQGTNLAAATKPDMRWDAQLYQNCVAIARLIAAPRDSGLALPGDDTGETAMDWGVVLASTVKDLKRGNIVCFTPYAGNWISNWYFFGAKQAILFGGRVHPDLILGTHMNNTFKPRSKHVLLQLEPVAGKNGNIYLPEGSPLARRTHRAVVLAVADDCINGVKPGDVVIYNSGSGYLMPCEDVADMYGVPAKDLFILPEDDCIVKLS